jgi:hypothetical protein
VAGWQAYPESLLAKLAEAENDLDSVIRIDRDPALFAHVLKAFDAPLPKEDTKKLQEELDFYGVMPADIMPTAKSIADRLAAIQSRLDTLVVSGLLKQIATLTSEKLGLASDDTMVDVFDGGEYDGNPPSKLCFWLSKPFRKKWSELQVRLAGRGGIWTATDKHVTDFPPPFKLELETRLGALGYTATVREAIPSNAANKVQGTYIELSW